MAPAAPSVDIIFRALADPTRRRVVERLGRSPASVREFAEPFGMALPSFVQHLRVLESSGLVRSHKTGPEDLSARPEALGAGGGMAGAAARAVGTPPGSIRPH
jgi:DNA-binding transcriptional ArsR family regulator